jgi:hypothetical protein
MQNTQKRPYELPQNSEIDDFKIGDEIGRGGLSIVYAADYDPFQDGFTASEE